MSGDIGVHTYLSTTSNYIDIMISACEFKCDPSSQLRRLRKLTPMSFVQFLETTENGALQEPEKNFCPSWKFLLVWPQSLLEMWCWNFIFSPFQEILIFSLHIIREWKYFSTTFNAQIRRLIAYYLKFDRCVVRSIDRCFVALHRVGLTCLSSHQLNPDHDKTYIRRYE